MFEPVDYDNIYIKEIAPDILHSPFLTKAFCSTLLDFATTFENWTQNEHDIYSTHDLHLKKEAEAFYYIIEEALHEKLFPIVARWWETDAFEVSNMFIVKYSEDTQTGLKYHHDSSHISMSIKLNDDYEGGVLNWPHKDYDNSEVSIGDILFWPSKVTHLHGTTPLTKGEKYAITIWTEECTR